MLLGENLPWPVLVSQLTKLNYTTEITTKGVTQGYKIKIKKIPKPLIKFSYVIIDSCLMLEVLDTDDSLEEMQIPDIKKTSTILIFLCVK